jgi:hypothetical protein
VTADRESADGGPGPEPPAIPGRITATLAGARHPLVAILLLMCFFIVLSGKPVDGILLFSVAVAISWDAGSQARRQAAAGGATAAADPGADDAPDGSFQRPIWQSRRPSRQMIMLGAVAAIAYALIVGSFTRYSWPATFGIVALGTLVVVIGWGGPLRQRQIPGKFGRGGVLVWSTLLVSCGLWELSALLMQPNFETSSYTHPTISTLTDPLLATAPGRSLALISWVGLGLFLMLR